ncbi:MAG TPA: HPr family phosphocarrier protein [Clostridia bacterium]|nr:HPr family phosphocarrier protein [Clostridia bacterium]
MKKVVIKSEHGIHARPASQIVNYAQKSPCEIFFIKDDNRYNAKSIMNIMGMGLKKGDEIFIEVTGEEKESVEEALLKLIESINA